MAWGVRRALLLLHQDPRVLGQFITFSCARFKEKNEKLSLSEGYTYENSYKPNAMLPEIIKRDLDPTGLAIEEYRSYIE